MFSRFIVILIMLLAGLSLSSCTCNTTVSDLKNDGVGVIVTGCTTYISKNKRPRSCTVIWERENGEQFIIKDNTEVKFIQPGTYRLVKYNYNDPYGHVKKYQKFPDSISLFTDINIKSGEVLYIGNLEADFKNNKKLINALNFIQKSKEVKFYLEKKYPEIASQMKIDIVQLTAKAQLFKILLNR